MMLDIKHVREAAYGWKGEHRVGMRRLTSVPVSLGHSL
ncbi:hypothetical protein LEMLEM_LOCUS12315 [Lemmus lemmus]